MLDCDSDGGSGSLISAGVGLKSGQQSCWIVPMKPKVDKPEPEKDEAAGHSCRVRQQHYAARAAEGPSALFTSFCGKPRSEVPAPSRVGLSDMLTTGNQLTAARALAGISQAQLAKAASINVTTISAMEGKGATTLGSGLDTIRAVMNVLEAAGIELLDNGPGVRLKAK
jgi:hypothetical protein